ncbi:hypothetical protein ACOMHN_037513 [Nucella lapillus]
MEGDGTPSADAESSLDREEIRRRRLAYFQTGSTPENVWPSTTNSRMRADKQGTSRRSSELAPGKTDNTKVTTNTSQFHVSVKASREDSRVRQNSQTENYVSYTSSKLAQDNDQSRWASSASTKPSTGERAYNRPVRKSGDKEVERLFSNIKSTSASEIPSLSLVESVDIDSVSVFKNRADVEDLGLSTHRPESSSDIGEHRQVMRQRSMSSESLLLGSKAEEIRSLLGEEKYREFVEKSERELNHLHKVVDSQEASVNWSEGSTYSDRLIRADGSAPRNIPTPPPQPPSPQPSGASIRRPTPRRRLRSSSPQQVSKTLQDIARTKEVREGAPSRNYEQVVIPHNVTFSADEIYRQAYGGDSSSRSDVRKSSGSMGSSYQDTSFWNSMTPRQMAGGVSPTSPHTAPPVFQPHFMPVSGGGGSMHPPAPPQPMASPGAYYYPPGGVAVSMAGGGGAGGQFAYSHQPNLLVPVSPGTSPQSPDTYFYQVHPLSQSMTSYPPPSSPMQSPAGLSWQYAHPPMGQDFQGPGQQMQGPPWGQFAPRMQHNSPSYGPGWQQGHVGYFQGPGKGVGEVEKGKGARSSAEHAEAVRLYHEQQRQEQERKAYSRSSSQAASGDLSASGVERYFSSMGMPPPNYPPPPYHLHHPSPTSHPLQSPKQAPNHTFQPVNQRSADSTPRSSNTLRRSEDDDDDMTTVTRSSWATGTSIKAGGITERLEQMGIDPGVVQSIRQHPDVAAADEETLEAMRNLVRVCPECGAVNKEYMTWCLHCGGVLIGVDPVPTKDLKKKNREKKGGVESSARVRKAPSSAQAKGNGAVSAEGKHRGSQESLRSDRAIPVKIHHHDSAHQSDGNAKASVGAGNDSPHEPFLEFEEIIEEEVIYNPHQRDQGENEPGETAERTPVVELNHNALQREAVVENSLSEEENVEEHYNALEEVAEMKESPESGRGASASSSPCRRNISQELSEDAGELSQNTLEVSDNKDSGRPSSGEGAESRNPLMSSQLVAHNGPRRTDREINDICEVINDPIIRGFIKSYLQKKPQDPTPDFRQPPPNNRKAGPQGSSSERRSSETTKAGKKQVQKTMSLDTEALNSKSAPGKKEETPKKKGHKKSTKKGHEAIDVEIFAIEETKMMRSSTSGPSVVPKLNLFHSSDEEDDSSDRTGSLQGAGSIAQGGSSDSSSPRGDTAPVNYSSDIHALLRTPGLREDKSSMAPPLHSHSPEPAHHHPNPELANSNFHYLRAQVDSRNAASGGKKSGQARQPQRRPVASRVRSSVEAPPPNRNWARSSVAWSSYHPRELRTRSSVNLKSGGGSGGGGVRGPGNFRASVSTDNLTGPVHPPDMPASQRPRPASADQHNRRRGNRGRPSSAGRGQRPYSAGFYSTPQFCEGARDAASGDHPSSPQQSLAHPQQDGSDSIQSLRSSNTDIEGRPIHRLAIQEDTLPLIPAGPNTALKIYDRCSEKSPRSDVDLESKWLFLPDELWLHVFTYLPQLALYRVMMTCKQLYRVALDPQLWKRVTVRKKSVRTEWLAEIARRHPVSLAMVQCHGDNLSDNALRDLFKEVAPKLKELNFSRCSKGKLIGDEILLHASTHCRLLTHVDASWCHVTDVGLSALAGCCHRLESLCLNGCQQITDDSLKTVVERHGNSLRVLELFGCFSLSPASFRYLAEFCTFLRTLNIGQCYKISDSNMVTLSASLCHVETLDLRGCKKLGDSSIRKIVRSCRRLRHLTLANCPLLSNAAIVEIATYSTDIRSLDVCGCSNISDTSIQTLVNNCFRLTSVDISSTSCTHRSVLMMAESSRCLESAKFNFLADIHERSLAKLVRNCKRLNTIHLYGCNVRDVAAIKRFNRFLNVEL